MNQQTAEAYPWTIEQSSSSLIIALSDAEVGKVQMPSKLVFVNAITKEPVSSPFEMPDIQNEMATLIYANQINDLMPRFIRMQDWELYEGHMVKMLVMERVYPLPIHHFEVSVREGMMEQFEQKMKELHDHHFVHGDLERPTTPFNRGDQAWMYQNIVQTQKGLRLLDAGFGTIMNKDNIRNFVGILMREKTDIEDFKSYYLAAKI
jgi:hypothetical protein